MIAGIVIGGVLILVGIGCLAVGFSWNEKLQKFTEGLWSK